MPKAPTEVAADAPATDREGIEAELGVVVRDSYRLLSQGYDNVYLDGLAHDPRLILIDVEPGEMQVGFEDGIAAARRIFDGDEYELWSKRLEIHVARDRMSAWVHDDLSYRVQRGRRRATIPLRMTALYERRDGRWQKTLEHVSFAMPTDEAAALGTPIAAERFTSETAGGEVGAKVHDLVVASLGGVAAGDPRISLDPDALAIGVAPEPELRGAAIAGAPSAAILTGARAVTATALRVEVGRTGTVAWAAAILQMDGAEGSYAARGTWVAELRQGEWRLVQTHLSAPVAADTLAAEVFGAPDAADQSGGG